jgi:hypothetical protein
MRQVDVPDPIPLDPARDVPLATLGSVWIVAAGPSSLGQPDFRGDAYFGRSPSGQHEICVAHLNSIHSPFLVSLKVD